jgi:ferrous iron transport protein B
LENLSPWLLGLPHDIAPVMVLGFLRKDVSIALLAPFNLDRQQFVVASIFMVLYIPCIASFLTLIKELGFLAALKTMGIVFVSAIAVTALLHGIFVLVNGCGPKVKLTVVFFSSDAGIMS